MVFRLYYNILYDENIAANLSFIFHFQMIHIEMLKHTNINIYFGSENVTPNQFYLLFQTKRTVRNRTDTNVMKTKENRENKKFTRFQSETA